MLPFLKNKQEGAYSGPVETKMREPDEMSESYHMLDAICDDMMEAFQKKDRKMLKSALEALCEYVQEVDEEQDEQLMDKE